MLIDSLCSLVTRRTADLFLVDVEAHKEELHEGIEGRRVLVIGGAGSIGAATVSTIAAFQPHALHVVDQNENDLVEVVRDLRSGSLDLKLRDFRTFPLDYGSEVMHRLLLEESPYDLVLNFTGVKHVRSEKDICSLLHMLDTNIVKSARFLRWLSQKQVTFRYFCVSTDKAANPVNLMGASKRIMEHLIFSGEVVPNLCADITSARFANVAFSNGSLLDGLLKRLVKRQPLAVPRETRRYFITLREAGYICLLAAVCAPHRAIVIPRLKPSEDLRDLEAVAFAILRYNGFEPRVYQNDEEARCNVLSDTEKGYYPLLLTPLDTSGEKPYEEFVGTRETSVEIGMVDLLAVRYSPASSGTLSKFLRKVEELVSHPDMKVSREEVVSWISAVVPELQHRDTGKSLDDRM